jgi:hypothetical protein
MALVSSLSQHGTLRGTAVVTRRWVARSIPAVLAMLSLLLVAPATKATAADDAGAGFPLTRGTSWVYEGEARWRTSPDLSQEVMEQPVTWRMEVVDVIERGLVTAAVMRGHPRDVFTQRSPLETTPSEYLIIRAGTDRYYEIYGDTERVAAAVARLRDPSDLLVGLVRDEDLMLDLPLRAGKRICDASQITRQDSDYCWLVAAEHPANLTTVAGAPTGANLIEYTLRNWALSGHIEYDFVHGIGITRFTGVHLGVFWGIELKLTEFQPG